MTTKTKRNKKRQRAAVKINIQGTLKAIRSKGATGVNVPLRSTGDPFILALQSQGLITVQPIEREGKEPKYLIRATEFEPKGASTQ